MIRWFLAPIIRIAYGIQEAGMMWEVYRDTVRRRGEDETISRKVLDHCDSRAEAEAVVRQIIRRTVK